MTRDRTSEMFILSIVTVHMFFKIFRGLFSTSSGYVLCNGMYEEICKLHSTCKGRATSLNAAVFYAVTDCSAVGHSS